MASFTCPVKAGHGGRTSLIFHILPNFIMLLDALTNTYLGLRETKDGDKAKSIKKISFEGTKLLKPVFF